MFTTFNSFLEVANPLTADVINKKDFIYSICLVLHCLTDWIVDVDVPEKEIKIWSYNNIANLYRSPFWKSTTQFGTKHPCREQAHAPIPVASRLLAWAFAWLIALWFEHFDFWQGLEGVVFFSNEYPPVGYPHYHEDAVGILFPLPCIPGHLLNAHLFLLFASSSVLLRNSHQLRVICGKATYFSLGNMMGLGVHHIRFWVAPPVVWKVHSWLRTSRAEQG